LATPIANYPIDGGFMTSPFFRIEMLPAKHGDALWIEYGTEQRTRRILIDGGPINAWAEVSARLARLPPGDQSVELVVISHVDTDHIEGLIRLMAEPEPRWPIVAREIWFNGWRHIDELDTLGGREGEFLSELIHHRAPGRWNKRFDNKAVCTGKLEDERVDLADGMRLTLVSPNAKALSDLKEDWKKSTDKWDIPPGDFDAALAQLADENRFHPDSELTLGPADMQKELLKVLKGRDGSTANGSSIGFLAEFSGKSCLLLADAHAKVVCESLRNLGYTAQKPLKVDALKMAHHGSRNNITQELLELVDARHYLVSTNGDKFGHPDDEAIEAVIQGSRRKPTLWFNYRSDHNIAWKAESLKPGARFSTRYPLKGKSGITVKL
jgi:beta-lactamase superfamily II metal-dependent hydrolase